MLEIIYDKLTKQIKAWNSDTKSLNSYKLKEDESRVILDIDPPNLQTDWYIFDEVKQSISGNPDYIFTPPRDPFAEIDDIKVRLEIVEKSA